MKRKMVTPKIGFPWNAVVEPRDGYWAARVYAFDITVYADDPTVINDRVNHTLNFFATNYMKRHGVQAFTEYLASKGTPHMFCPPPASGGPERAVMSSSGTVLVA